LNFGAAMMDFPPFGKALLHAPGLVGGKLSMPGSHIMMESIGPICAAKPMVVTSMVESLAVDETIGSGGNSPSQKRYQEDTAHTTHQPTNQAKGH